MIIRGSTDIHVDGKMPVDFAHSGSVQQLGMDAHIVDTFNK